MRPDEARSWLSQHSFLWFLGVKNLTILKRQANANIGADKLTFDSHELSREFRSRRIELVRVSHAAAPIVAVAGSGTTPVRNPNPPSTATTA